MDRKEDASKSLIEEVKLLISNNKMVEIRELLEEYHIIDVFEIMEYLDEDSKIKLFEILPIDVAASILEESDVEFFSSILSKIDKENGKNILELMSLDDMADIIILLPEKERESIIDLLSEESANNIRELLFYEEESTGGIMATDYISINKDMTVKETIEYMRKNAEDAETIYYIYVIDDEEKLVGVLSLRELITSRDATRIEDIMSENIISVHVNEDREEAVRLVAKYDLVAIPVIDDNKKIKGIITVDDIIDIIEEEATEDMYKFAGTSEYEREVVENKKSTTKEQISTSVKARIPLLIITLIGGIISSFILTKTPFLEKNIYSQLIFFVPLVIAMGGNIATQASARTIMAQVNQDIELHNSLKEGIVGSITGFICSILVGILIYMINENIYVAFIVSISLIINMIFGAIIGSLMPVVLKKIKLDPSNISAPIVTTMLDITGLIIYLIVAVNLLEKIV